MTSRYRVSLGGVQLDSLDKNILIRDVSYSPVTRRDTTFETANLNGFDTSASVYEGQNVTVQFEIHIYDTASRNAVCQKINQWANTRGSLVVNDRSGQYLPSVVCVQYASLKSVKNWTDPISIVFSTERIPFWQSNTEKAVNIYGTNVKGTLKMDGNIAYSLVTVNVTAVEPFSSLQLTVGNMFLKLKGLSVSVGSKLVVDYVNNRYMRIRVNGSSVMTKLDPSSSDDLRANCGANVSVGVISNGRVNAEFRGRGCWL